MTSDNQNMYPWAMLQAARSIPRETLFMKVDDEMTIQRFRDRHGNKELFRSTWRSSVPDPSAPRNYPLHFRVASQNLEQVRIAALEACYYMADHFGISQESVDLIYNGGGIVRENEDRPGCDGRHASEAGAGTATPAEIVMLVLPSVFGGSPMPLAALNCDLARQMVADGLHVDVDSYGETQQFVRLPNSFSDDTGRFVVPIRAEELLNLDAKAVRTLAAQKRPDDSYAVQRLVPEASEWFAEALRQAERHAKRQLELRQKLRQTGWFIPFCLRRIEWATDMARDQAVEACRVTSAWYALVGASEDEVYEHVRRIDRRNGIGDYLRLRNIVAFGLENPAFVGCEHPLLHRFCPAGGCLMKELINELKNPRLFA